MADEPIIIKVAPKVKWVVVGYAVGIAGILVGHGLDEGRADVVLNVKEGFSIFAVFYVFAQSLERVLEPVSRLWQADEVKTAEAKVVAQGTTGRVAERAAVAMLLANPAADVAGVMKDAGDAAKEKDDEGRKLAVIRANKEVVLWGLATLLAALVCGYFGIRFLETLFTFGPDNQPTGAFRFMDLGLTALVIGSGTKPLHDLIDRLQKPKQPTTTS